MPAGDYRINQAPRHARRLAGQFALQGEDAGKLVRAELAGLVDPDLRARPELGVLGGEHLFWRDQFIAAGGVGFTSRGGILNPSGSNVVAVVTLARVRVGGVPATNWARAYVVASAESITWAGSPGIVARDSGGGFVLANRPVRWIQKNNAALDPLEQAAFSWDPEAGEPALEAVIRPGHALVFAEVDPSNGNAAVNAALFLAVAGYYRAAQQSELPDPEGGLLI